LAWLYRYSIRHPIAVVIVAVLTTLAVAPGAARLKLRTDGHALVPARASEVLYDQSIRAEFDTDDPIVVFIRADRPEGIFNPQTLALVKELTAAFLEIEGPGPSNVVSLATERGDRVVPGTLRFRPFLDPLPSTPQELDILRNDLREIELYSGTLVSRDEKAASILVGVPSGADRSGIYRRIQDILAAKGPVSERIRVIGAPVAEALLGTHILEDLGVPSVLLGHRLLRGDQADTWRMPRTFYGLRLFIARHIGLVPIAIAVMAIVFLLSFRSLAATLLPLTEVAACLIVVFGLMGWFGVPVYLTIAVLPVILTAMGVADEIHIFARYTGQLRNRPDDSHLDAVDATMAEMWVPVVKTSVTTAVGFLSFALSPIGPVRAFGVFTAVGIIFCMLWSLTVIPAQLVLIAPRRFVSARRRVTEPDRTQAAPLLARIAAALVRYRYAVLVIAAVVTVAAPFGVSRLVVQDSWIGGFAPDSRFYRATQAFNEQFLGTHILLLCVDTGSEVLAGELKSEAVGHNQLSFPPDLVSDPETLAGQHIDMWRVEGNDRDVGPPDRARPRQALASRIESATRIGDRIVATTTRRRGSPKFVFRLAEDGILGYRITPRRLTRPGVLRRIADLEAFIEARREHMVGGALGPAAYMRTTHFMVRARREEFRCIPDDVRTTERVWSRYRLARGADRLHQLIDPDFARGLVTVFMTNANFVDTANLMRDIRAYERDQLKPHGISLGFAGDVAVSQKLIDAIVTTQTRSLLGSLLGILAVTAVMGRSLRWGLYCVLPCGLAVLINFAGMGLFGMPLGVATSMFAGMTLGIGVDFAIHLMERYRLARERGLELESALSDAVTATGPAIIIDALAVALGFGVMILSQVPANARLGVLVLLSIVGCLAATVLLLPALLRIWPPRIKPPRPELTP